MKITKPTVANGLSGKSTEKSPAPSSPAAPGLQAAQGESQDRSEGSKPTREERRPVNAALKQAVQAQVLAAEAESERQLAVQMAATKMGRPTTFTEEQGDAICTWIARGKSLSSYCKQHDIGMEQVYRWLRARADFRERYAQAHEDRADTLADEMLEMADQRGLCLEDAQMAKLSVETRKWIASKLRPSKYGERQEVAHTGAVSIRLGIPQRPNQTVEVIDSGAIQALPPANPHQH